MAEVPQTPDQFSNYYTQLLGSQGPASSTPAPVGFPKRADQPNEMGFLGRFVDILSRPLRIVSNPVQKALEMPEKYDAIRMEEAAGGDVSFGEKLAPVGSLLAAPFTGFFSDKDENKPYWADLIEKAQDVSYRNDPNYVDVENNVDPVTKGVVGFVGDVALDPLSWIPGVGFIKAGAKTAAVYDKIGDVAKGVAGTASKAGKKTAETVSQALSRTVTPTDAAAPELYDLTLYAGKSKAGTTQTFNSAEEAQAALDAARAKSRSKKDWVEVGEGQRPAGGANGYRIAPKNTAVREVAEGGVVDNIPASSIGSEVTKNIAEGAKGGLNVTESASKAVANLVQAKTLPDGTKLAASTLKFLTDLSKPVVQAATKAEKVAAPKVVGYPTWQTEVLQKIKNGEIEDIPFKVSDTAHLYTRDDQQIIRGIKTLGQALEVARNLRTSQNVRAGVLSAVKEGAYLPYAKQITAGKRATVTGRLLDDDAVVSEAAIKDMDLAKESAPQSTVSAAVYENARETLGKFKDAYIAKFKKALKLPTLKHDFSKTRVSPRAQEIARVYDDLVSDPTNPAVREAYAALGKESRQQYEYMTKELGIKVDFVDADPYNVVGKNGEMVPNSKAMIEDVVNNKHLFVRDSVADFKVDPHPIMTAEENNIFRAVHEFFGHAASGSNFKAAGEEGAWISHSSMFSMKARQVLTTETRGQNSWYNFFPDKPQAFATQKAALFPQEFVNLPTARETAAAAKGAVLLSLSEKLNALSAEGLAKAELLFGPKLLADLRAMQDSNLSILIDEVQSILSGSGMVPIFGFMDRGGVRAELLKRFDISPEVRVAAEGAVAKKIDALPVAAPETVVKAVENLSDDATFVEQFSQQLKASTYFEDDAYVDYGIGIMGRAFAAGKKMLDEAIVTKEYPELTNNGKNRNNTEWGLGKGRNLEEANSHFQYTFIREVFLGVGELFKGVPVMLKSGVPKVDGAGEIVYKKKPVFVDPKTNKPYLGDALARRQGDYIIEVTRAMERVLESKGIPVVIDHPVSGKVYALRWSDIFEGLKAGLISNAQDLGVAADSLSAEANWLYLLFNNATTGTAYTKVMDAVATALSGGTTDDVLEVLKSNTRRNIRKDGEEGVIPNWLSSDDFEGYFGHNPIGKGQKVPEAPVGIRNEPNIKNGKTVGYRKFYEREVAAAKFADAIMASRTAFAQIAEENAKRMTALVDAEIGQIVPPVAENFMRLAKTPKEAANAIRAAAEIGNMNKDFGKVLNAFDASVVASTLAVRAALGDRVANMAKASADLADGVKAENKAAVKKAQKERMDETDKVVKDYDEGAEKITREGTDPTDDAQTQALKQDAGQEIGDNATSSSFRKEQSEGYSSIWGGFKGILDPLNRALNGKYGMNTKDFLWGWMTYHGQGIAMREFVNHRVKSLTKIARNEEYAKYLDDGKTTVLMQGFRNLQRPGVSSPANTILRAVEDDLSKHMAMLFDLSPNNANAVLGNQFFRTGAGMEYINDMLGQYRVLGDNVTPPNGIYFDIGQASDAVRKGQASDKLTAAANQWRTWNVKDPVEFIGRMNAAAGRMAADVSFVEKFLSKAKSFNLVSDKKIAGYVPLLGKEKSHYGRLIQEEVFVPEEVAEVFRAIDTAASQSRGLTSDFGKFINKYMDPITNTWKYAITLPRPGHHTRNMVGDLSFTYFAEGTRHFLRSGRDAFKVMSLTNQYDGVDLLRTLTQEGVTIPRESTVIASGKFGKITANEILQAAKERGLLPPAAIIEDLYDADVTASKFSRFLQKAAAVGSVGTAARGGKVENFVMGVSEYRDHYARLQHFIQYIHKAQDGEFMVRRLGKLVKPKNIDELFNFAGERVMKYHPDVSQLSAFEAKYMRRVIPFYSWTRGAVTALGEASVMAPNRIQTINKAAYNFGIAMGIDPNSLYDPFPDDQLFPSFLQEEMQGPMFEVGGRYYGISPGIASWDVFNMLGPDPIRGVVGATNPLLRAPIELLAGASLGTGARIRDYSDYVDSSIPGVNYISSISGQSVTGSLASLLTGGGFDPQYQYAVGNKGPVDQATSFFNYVTGLGLKDYSRPNYINYAEIEARNKAAEEARGNQR